MKIPSSPPAMVGSLWIVGIAFHSWPEMRDTTYNYSYTTHLIGAPLKCTCLKTIWGSELVPPKNSKSQSISKFWHLEYCDRIYYSLTLFWEDTSLKVAFVETSSLSVVTVDRQRTSLHCIPNCTAPNLHGDPLVCKIDRNKLISWNKAFKMGKKLFC